MSWYSSDRRKRLPSDWNRIRSLVLRRDSFRCQMRFPGCNEFATDVDHIHRGDNHSLDNLQAACSACHKKKTQAEAQSARKRKRARRFRPRERHPGMR